MSWYMYQPDDDDDSTSTTDSDTVEIELTDDEHVRRILAELEIKERVQRPWLNMHQVRELRRAGCQIWLEDRMYQVRKWRG